MSVAVEFVEPEELPVPPEQVRIRQLVAELLPDGRRLKVDIRLTPFRERPRVDLAIFNAADEEVVETTIVEATDAVMGVTMHLPPKSEGGGYSLRATVAYPDHGEVASETAQFSVA